jgi:hypothetical protein
MEGQRVAAFVSQFSWDSGFLRFATPERWSAKHERFSRMDNATPPNRPSKQRSREWDHPADEEKVSL